MNIVRFTTLLSLFVSLFTHSSWAQMNLTSFYSRDVKQAINVDTRVDSVQTATTVSNGVATTILTMTVTPTPYSNQYYGSTLPTGLDSIEVTLSFWLPNDFVAKNMWLWVDGQPQTAYIQDRNLASAQYNEIVGARKDPALLETWGNGSYNFRMFPAKLRQSRKVAIEFQHTFDNDSVNLLTAHVPLSFDTTAGSWYGSSALTKNIAFVQCSFSAADDQSYATTIPGLGNGSFSFGTPLVLKASSVTLLGSATISTVNRSGASSEFFWDGSDKNANHIAGCAITLAESTVVLDPEPDTRIIVLDVRNRTWDWDDYYAKYYATNARYGNYTNQNYPTVDMWVRAQKFAVLSLQNYVKEGQRFNVVLPGAKPTSVFSAPVSWSRENLNAAYRAIIDAIPDPAASTEAAVAEASAQAGTGVTILISDLYAPHDYDNWIYDASTSTSTNISKSAPAFDSLIARVGAIMKASEGLFFTITDCYQLNNLATNKGGFNLASLRWDYYYNYYESTSFTNKTIPALPKLFGNNAYYGRGITDLAISGSLKDIVFATEGNNYWYYGGRFFSTDMMLAKQSASKTGLAKSSKLWMPYYEPRTTKLHIAGIIPAHLSTTQINLTIKGRMGGLGFTKNISGNWIPNISLLPVADNVQWAYVKSEQLGATNWGENAEVIKKLGLDYHIVTRQTSLLALEPGMVLWPDSNALTTGSSGTKSASNTILSADAAARPTTADSSGINSLDAASLEELIAMSLSIRQTPAIANGVFGIHLRGTVLNISLAKPVTTGTLSIALYSLSGKLIFSQNIPRNRLVGNAYQTNLSALRNGNAQGLYLLKISLGATHQAMRISLK